VLLVEASASPQNPRERGVEGLEEFHDFDQKEGAEAQGEGFEGETLVSFDDGR